MSTTYLKRSKEKLRQDKQREKELKRQQRKSAKENKAAAPPGVDPDLEGIVAGPQPLPYDLDEPYDG